MPANRMLAIGWLLLSAMAASAQENIALGKPYVLHPQPNYEYTRNDPNALARLTDGAYTDTEAGQFWTQQTTVCWATPTS
ncbi:MAG TPA: hypothetical protein QGH10_02770 [Armatimonadota bacterium]|nr:hypothetical protein [Armatimonadota bacterium]